MADNFDVKDASESTITKAAADVGSGILADKVVLVNGADAAEAPVDATAGLKVNLGADNDVTLATLPDTAAGDLASQTTDLAAIEVLQTTIAGDTTSLDTKVGEVQATPTSNTVLGRLKDIDDSVQAGAVSAGTVASRSTDILSVMPAEIPTREIISGASTDNTVVTAAGAGNSIVVTSLFIVAADAVTVAFESSTTTPLTGTMSLAANSGFVLPYNPDGWFATDDNELLNMTLGGAVQVSGALTYVVR
jgi:hypothetical protein